jgi:hypothetical protein
MGYKVTEPLRSIGIGCFGVKMPLGQAQSLDGLAHLLHLFELGALLAPLPSIGTQRFQYLLC